jgi:outer membrane murein-binding lipoprotein Lpp
MRNIYTILIVTMFLLMGCGNQAAIDEAKANQITVKIEQDALNQKQDRAEAVAAAEQKAIKDAYWNNVWNSVLVSVKKIANFVVYSVGIALCVIALGGGWTVKETVKGLGEARVDRARLEAQLIHMDENTRTFPAFTMKTVGGGHFLTMLATGQTFKLDETIAANPLLIAALAQVSTTGVYAREASKAAILRGGEVETFNPTLISGITRDIPEDNSSHYEPNQ